MNQDKEVFDIDEILTNGINIMDSQAVEYIYSESIPEEVNDDEIKLKTLLRHFELEELYTVLKDARITYKNLKYLRDDDIKEIIKPVGLRAEFRGKLFQYLKSENLNENATLSNSSKVMLWLDKNRLTDSPSSSSLHCTATNKLKPISTLLEQSAKGKSIIEYYAEKSMLTKNLREDLIQIILEEVVTRGVKLRPESFIYIVEEIIEIFPNEKCHQEFYFIPRHNKKNPAGKLYAKYFNLKTKKRKLHASNQCLTTPEEVEPTEAVKAVEVDQSVSLSLKAVLKRDCSNWEETLDKWEKTVALRKIDFQKLSQVEFLLEWPRYSDSRGSALINIDFKYMYPEKDHLLKSKWDGFKAKIVNFYENNIKNPLSKTLLQQAKVAKQTNKIDCEDYLITVLLNSILLPSARLKSSEGKSKRKATINDANESFILEVSSVGEIPIKITEIISKYYFNKIKIQPFLIVEGQFPENPKSFYTYFDKTLYKFSNFLESLDTCFKIFQIFDLKYPQTCEYPWLFIQQYFYEIFTNFDCKNSNLSMLLSFLQDVPII